MNERIKQLMDLAGIDVEAVENLGEMPTALKFAELIVKECASICMKNQYEGTPLYNNGSISSAEFIKQHFGVEE
jgi:hypothetical protein